MIKKTITTLADARQAASSLMLEIEYSNELYELWAGDHYKGSFMTIKALAAQLQLLHAIRDEEESEVTEKAQRLNVLLTGATEAAILRSGKVIGSCRTNIRSGACITLAAAVSPDGSPVATSSLKVSRSARNLQQSNELPVYSARHHMGEVFYVL